MATTNDVAATGASLMKLDSITGGYLNSLADGTLVDDTGAPIFSNIPIGGTPSNPSRLPRNTDWVQHGYSAGVISPNNDNLNIDYDNAPVALDDIDLRNANYTNALLKCFDSSVGGNIPINPPAQYCRFADVRIKGLQPNAIDVSIAGFANKKETKYMGSIGMGVQYSELIDDPSQIIHLRFGTTTHNSLSQYLLGFYNSDIGTLARKGILSDDGIWNSGMYMTGKIIAYAMVPSFIIPIGIMFIGSMAKHLSGIPSSKLTSFKPTMPIYWNTANHIFNSIANYLGVSSGWTDTYASEATANTQKGSGFNAVAQFLPPDCVNKSTGNLDIFAIATRASKASVAHDAFMRRIFTAENMANDSTTMGDTVRNFFLGEARPNTPWEKQLAAYANRYQQAASSMNKGIPTLDVLLAQYMSDSKLSKPSGDSASPTELDQSLGVKNEPVEERKWKHQEDQPDGASGIQALGKWLNDSVSTAAGQFLSVANDGDQWVSFRVDYTGSVSDSFSNSFAPSGIAGQLNSKSREFRDTIFESIQGRMVKGVADTTGITSLLQGLADNAVTGSLLGLFGNATAQAPDHWDSSSASIGRSSYSATFSSVYGNPVSQLLHVWLPFSLIAAGSWPLSTGKQSHTAPFYCQLFDVGRGFIRYGMIDSFSAVRGGSGDGFSRDHRANSVKVSFSVKDMNNIVAAQVMPGFSLEGALSEILDTDNDLQDYLMGLSGMNRRDVINRVPMVKYQLNRVVNEYKSYFTASAIGSTLATLPGVKMLSAIMRGNLR